MTQTHWRSASPDPRLSSPDSVQGTTKSGRSRTVSIDTGTVQVLGDHRKRQAEERLTVGTEWKGTDDYLFCTAWGELIHPDNVSSLMATLIKGHNEAHTDEALRTRGCMICGTSTRQRCCWLELRFMSSPLASGTSTHRSPCASTPT